MKIRLNAVKRAVSFLLALAMVVTMLPEAGLTSYAEDLESYVTEEEAVVPEETVQVSENEDVSGSQTEITEEEPGDSEEAEISEETEETGEEEVNDGIDRVDISACDLTFSTKDENILNIYVNETKLEMKNGKAVWHVAEGTYPGSKKIQIRVCVANGYEVYWNESIYNSINTDLLSDDADETCYSLYPGDAYDGTGYAIFYVTYRKLQEVGVKEDTIVFTANEKTDTGYWYTCASIYDDYVNCFKTYLGGQEFESDNPLYLAADTDKASEDKNVKITIDSGHEFRFNVGGKVKFQYSYYDISTGETTPKTAERIYELSDDSAVTLNADGSLSFALSYGRVGTQYIYSYILSSIEPYACGQVSLTLGDQGAAFSDISIYEWTHDVSYQPESYSFKKVSRSNTNSYSFYLDYNKSYVYSLKAADGNGTPYVVKNSTSNYAGTLHTTVSDNDGKEYTVLYEGAVSSTSSTSGGPTIDLTLYRDLSSLSLKNVVVYCNDNDMENLKIIVDGKYIKNESNNEDDLYYRVDEDSTLKISFTTKDHVTLTGILLDGSKLADKKITKKGSTWTFTVAAKDVDKISYTVTKECYVKVDPDDVKQVNGVYQINTFDQLKDLVIYLKEGNTDITSGKYVKAVVDDKKKTVLYDADVSSSDQGDFLGEELLGEEYQNLSKILGKTVIVTFSDETGKTLASTKMKIYAGLTSLSIKEAAKKTTKIKDVSYGEITCLTITQDAGTTKTYTVKVNSGAAVSALSIMSTGTTLQGETGSATLTDGQLEVKLEDFNLPEEAYRIAVGYQGGLAYYIKVVPTWANLKNTEPTLTVTATTDTGFYATVGMKKVVEADYEDLYYQFTITCDLKNKKNETAPENTVIAALSSDYYYEADVTENDTSRIMIVSVPAKRVEEFNDHLIFTLTDTANAKNWNYKVTLTAVYKDDAANVITAKSAKVKSLATKTKAYATSISAKVTKKSFGWTDIADENPLKIATISYDNKATVLGYTAVDTTYPNYGGISFTNDPLDPYSLYVAATSPFDTDYGTVSVIYPGKHTIQITPVTTDQGYAKSITITVTVEEQPGSILLSADPVLYKQDGKAATLQAKADVYALCYDYEGSGMLPFSISALKGQKVNWYIINADGEELSSEDYLYGKVSVSSKGVVTVKKDLVLSEDEEDNTFTLVATSALREEVNAYTTITITNEPETAANVGLASGSPYSSSTAYYVDYLWGKTVYTIDTYDEATVTASDLNGKKLVASKAGSSSDTVLDLDINAFRAKYNAAQLTNYASSNKSLATINSNGVITVKKTPAVDTKITFSAKTKNGGSPVSITITLKGKEKLTLDDFYAEVSSMDGGFSTVINTQKTEVTQKINLMDSNELLSISLYGLEDKTLDPNQFKFSITGGKFISLPWIEQVMKIYSMYGISDNADLYKTFVMTGKTCTITVTVNGKSRKYIFKNDNYVTKTISTTTAAQTLYLASREEVQTIRVNVGKAYAGQPVKIYSNAATGSAAQSMAGEVYSEKLAGYLTDGVVGTDGYVTYTLYTGTLLDNYEDCYDDYASLGCADGFAKDASYVYDLIVVKKNEIGDAVPVTKAKTFTIKTSSAAGKTGKSDYTPVTSYTMDVSTNATGTVQMTPTAKTKKYKSEVSYAGFIRDVNVNGQYADVAQYFTINSAGLLTFNASGTYTKESFIATYGDTVKLYISYRVTPQGCTPIETSTTVTIKLK